jgi:hypothetical protein
VTSQTIGTTIFGAYSLCRADGPASELASQRVAQDNDAVISGLVLCTDQSVWALVLSEALAGQRTIARAGEFCERNEPRGV